MLNILNSDIVIVLLYFVIPAKARIQKIHDPCFSTGSRIKCGMTTEVVMFKRGIATFTLDYGKCPRWLFERMVKLGREMARVIVAEYGPDEFVKRIADPVWFQALGTVLAFDWNASGLTTILTAALNL